MIKTLMRIWKKMPMWLHVLATRLTQPKFNAGVCTLIFDEEGKVLLFKHTYRKFEWGIPGGSLEYQEPPEEAIVREFYEESRLTIRVEKLLKVSSAKDFPHLSIVYLCKIIGGEFQPSHEVLEMKYFAVSDLPQMLYAEKDLIHWALKNVTKDGGR